MFVTPTPALMTVNAFRGKQEGTGNTSAFAPSFTKEKIVKVRKHYKKKMKWQSYEEFFPELLQASWTISAKLIHIFLLY